MKTSAKALSIREICSPIRHDSMKILARMDDRIYRGWKHQRVLEILHFWSFYFRVSGNFCITTNLENIFYVLSLFMEKYPFIIQSILIRCSQNVVDWLNSAFLPGIESFSERLLELVTGNNKHRSWIIGQKWIETNFIWRISLLLGQFSLSLSFSMIRSVLGWKIGKFLIETFFFRKRSNFLNKLFFCLKLEVVRHEVDEIKRGDFS